MLSTRWQSPNHRTTTRQSSEAQPPMDGISFSFLRFRQKTKAEKEMSGIKDPMTSKSDVVFSSRSLALKPFMCYVENSRLADICGWHLQYHSSVRFCHDLFLTLICWDYKKLSDTPHIETKDTIFFKESSCKPFIEAALNCCKLNLCEFVCGWSHHRSQVHSAALHDIQKTMFTNTVPFSKHLILLFDSNTAAQLNTSIQYCSDLHKVALKSETSYARQLTVETQFSLLGDRKYSEYDWKPFQAHSWSMLFSQHDALVDWPSALSSNIQFSNKENEQSSEPLTRRSIGLCTFCPTGAAMLSLAPKRCSRYDYHPTHISHSYEYSCVGFPSFTCF